jgi:hypothetical protein
MFQRMVVGRGSNGRPRKGRLARQHPEFRPHGAGCHREHETLVALEARPGREVRLGVAPHGSAECRRGGGVAT